METFLWCLSKKCVDYVKMEIMGAMESGKQLNELHAWLADTGVWRNTSLFWQ